MRCLLVGCVLAATLCGAGELSGRRAPGFSLPDSQIKQHDLADYRGRVVLLEIMQTSCPTCHALSEVLEKVKAKFGAKIAVLMITVPPDNTNTVKQFIATLGITSPVLFDCGQATGSYLRSSPQNPTIHFPHLFLIDREGQIRNDYGHEEAQGLEVDKLSAEIEALINAQPKPAKTQ